MTRLDRIEKEIAALSAAELNDLRAWFEAFDAKRWDGGGRDGNMPIVGREAFAKISAVEGITLGDDMKAAFEDFDRRKLSPAERRSEIISRFRKASGQREAAE